MPLLSVSDPWFRLSIASARRLSTNPGLSVFITLLPHVQGKNPVYLCQWEMVREESAKGGGVGVHCEQVLHTELTETGNWAQEPNLGTKEQLFAPCQEFLEEQGVHVALWGQVKAPY